MKITGYNDFYDGWLTAVLLHPIPENSTPPFRDGYNMAIETGPELAITILQSEIAASHILVKPLNQSLTI